MQTSSSVSNPPPVRVFWAPGCTSCLRTKEFLTRRGVAFESVNVAAQPTAMQELAALGARSIPVVSRGADWVYAQSLNDVTGFLGIAAAEGARLSPAALAQRVNIILPKAMGFVGQMSDEVLDGPFRDSWAPPRGLAHHVFRIVEAFLEAVQIPCELGYDQIMEGTHEVVAGQDVAGYGQQVLERFNLWWAGAKGGDFGVAMDTYYGPQTLHEVLERTTWHSAQHARQLMVVIESLGRAVVEPLSAADLADLPLPEKAWDDTAQTA
jgi:glutaredoxin